LNFIFSIFDIIFLIFQTYTFERLTVKVEREPLNQALWAGQYAYTLRFSPHSFYYNPAIFQQQQQQQQYLQMMAAPQQQQQWFPIQQQQPAINYNQLPPPAINYNQPPPPAIIYNQPPPPPNQEIAQPAVAVDMPNPIAPIPPAAAADAVPIPIAPIPPPAQNVQPEQEQQNNEPAQQENAIQNPVGIRRRR
jgi:hypothetical protein